MSNLFTSTALTSAILCVSDICLLLKSQFFLACLAPLIYQCAKIFGGVQDLTAADIVGSGNVNNSAIGRNQLLVGHYE